MNIADRLKKAEDLEKIERCPLFGAFPDLSVFGSQVSFSKDGDYLSLKDAQRAVTWLAEQLGLKIETAKESSGGALSKSENDLFLKAKFSEIFHANFEIDLNARVSAGEVQRILRDNGLRDNKHVNEFKKWVVRELGLSKIRNKHGHLYIGMKLSKKTTNGVA